jgi:hypothetical protein
LKKHKKMVLHLHPLKLFLYFIIGSFATIERATGICECGVREIPQATIILADGASGSTWLGQMLDQHHCSSSFVAKSSRLDGKVFVE